MARVTLSDLFRGYKIIASNAFEMCLEKSCLEENFKMDVWNICKKPATNPGEKVHTTHEWLWVICSFLYFQK